MGVIVAYFAMDPGRKVDQGPIGLLVIRLSLLSAYRQQIIAGPETPTV